MAKKILATLGYTLFFCAVLIITLNVLPLIFGERSEQTAEQERVSFENLSSDYFQTAMTESEEPEIYGEGYGMSIHHTDGTLLEESELVYNASEQDSIELFIRAINATEKSETSSIMLFAGEKPQLFQVDYNDESLYSFELDVPALSYIDIPVSVQPEIYTEADNPKLYPMMINYYDVTDEEIHSPKMTRFTSGIFYELITHTFIPRSHQVEIAPALPIRDAAREADTEHEIRSGLSIDPLEITTYPAEIQWDGKDPLLFEGYGLPGTYSTVVFLNRELLYFGDQPYFMWTIDEDEMTHYDIQLPEHLEAGEHEIFTLTFPLKSFMEFPRESRRVRLLKE